MSLGLTPAIAVATGRALNKIYQREVEFLLIFYRTLPTASPPGPTTAVATGFDDATPPTPAIAKPTEREKKKLENLTLLQRRASTWLCFCN